MDFKHETKLKDIVASSPGAAEVLEQAGVDYCCGGGHSLEQGCAQAGVSAEEILARLRSSGQPAGPEDAAWMTGRLADLTEHIRQKHHRYVREAIPRLDALLLEKVKAKHGERHPEIAAIEGLFDQVRRGTDRAYAEGGNDPVPLYRAAGAVRPGRRRAGAALLHSVRNPIQMMVNEHEAAGNQAIADSPSQFPILTPPDACASYQRLYAELREFEADLHQHVHLENNVLFPRAVALENES